MTEALNIRKISRKQLQALTWWCDSSPYRDLDAVICDGAVRSGKTLFMGISFVCLSLIHISAMCMYLLMVLADIICDTVNQL